MNSDPITFLTLTAIVVVWWFAVRAVAGKRFGMFHWIPVAMASFGIPMAIADITYQNPQASDWFFYGWNGLGLVLASWYFIRRRTRPLPLRGIPRYVILWHECPPGYERSSHWDFMLERDGVLRTWSLPEEPRAGARIVGEALADHRIAYLDYAGPVSGGRGTVTPWDGGTYESVTESETQWTVELTGGKLRGRVVLMRQPDDPQRWELLFSGS